MNTLLAAVIVSFAVVSQKTMNATKMLWFIIFEYCYARHESVEMRIGFRGDELDRIINSKKNIDQIKYPTSQSLETKRRKWETIQWREKTFPLARTYHLEIIKFWKQFNLDFPLDSNCMGCHHKSEEQIKQNWLESPEKLEWFARQEEKKAGRKIQTWKDSMIPYREPVGCRFRGRNVRQ